MGTKRSFKKVGANILKSSGPSSMEEFLKIADDTQAQAQETEEQSGYAQMHKEQRDERLHVFIDGTLADQLISEVYRRKKDKGCNKKYASKRRVVEDALEDYFDRRQMD
jgi:hypothetical protein